MHGQRTPTTGTTNAAAAGQTWVPHAALSMGPATFGLLPATITMSGAVGPASIACKGCPTLDRRVL
jgi:hypothetical protein